MEKEKPERSITDARIGEDVICINTTGGRYGDFSLKYGESCRIMNIRKVGNRVDFLIKNRYGSNWYSSKRFQFPKKAANRPKAAFNYRFDGKGRVYNPYTGYWITTEKRDLGGRDYWEADPGWIRKTGVLAYYSQDGSIKYADYAVLKPDGRYYPVINGVILEYYPRAARYAEAGLTWNPIIRQFNKPGHQWRRGRWWKDGDPNMPPPIPTIQELGVAWGNHSLGCGVKVLYNYLQIKLSDDKNNIRHPDNIAEGLQEEIKKSGMMTGIVLSVINPTEKNNGIDKVLEKAGFELLSTHINYNHNHNNYLYGLKISSMKKTEQARKF